ncbi:MULTISPECIES: hypothetical protein [Myxococcus]|uniref:hypothetical protein n=1 Tax=Myxococcus TaxID=32 RepID=UPI00112AEF4E|nr:MULTISPECIES: hypothetical protein [Myxococcus]QDE84904.1 hypothetical protein BHS07_27050 [Myxococcus xanthus]QDE99055.1 hypothetical protein BHS05_26285 [Myxococcus xanthus]QDF06731.1 hypothetical protein BHS04_26590 [Myxococcus xanthus]WAM24338.1 hypothetical protein OZ403_27855 [Myxococcus sp. NMCA1]
MKSKCAFRLGILLMTSLVSAGCGDGLEETQAPIDLSPSSLSAARLSFQRIDRLYESDPAAAVEASRRLRPKLDELNQLLARVEVSREHFIEFYDLQPGGILVVERGPVADGRVLRDGDVARHSAVELYRQLTRGATPPTALVSAESRRAVPDDAHVIVRDEAAPHLESSGGFAPDLGEQGRDGFSSVTQPLTSADGPFWRDSVCYKGGDFVDCWSNVTGNGWAAANAKTSFTQLAPYRGTVGLWVSYESSVKAAWNVAAGEWFSFHQYSGTYWTCPPLVACGSTDYYIRNHRWDVTDAVGDGYHFTYAFRWNCSGGLCTFSP